MRVKVILNCSHCFTQSCVRACLSGTYVRQASGSRVCSLLHCWRGYTDILPYCSASRLLSKSSVGEPPWPGTPNSHQINLSGVTFSPGPACRHVWVNCRCPITVSSLTLHCELSKNKTLTWPNTDLTPSPICWILKIYRLATNPDPDSNPNSVKEFDIRNRSLWKLPKNYLFSRLISWHYYSFTNFVSLFSPAACSTQLFHSTTKCV